MKSDLEKEYKVVRNKINLKVKEALLLLREANALVPLAKYKVNPRDEYGYSSGDDEEDKVEATCLYDIQDEANVALEGLMGECGWNTSSWHC